MNLIVLLIGISLIVTPITCNKDKGNCSPESTLNVIHQFPRVCSHKYANYKRDVNQEFWYYKLNQIGSERRNNELSSGAIRKPVDDSDYPSWPAKNQYKKPSYNRLPDPWPGMSTWFNIAPQQPSSPVSKSNYDNNLDMAEIEMLMDPVNNGGSEIDMPIERWRRLGPQFFELVLEFIKEKCCKEGCFFPDDYVNFARDKKMFDMLAC